MVWKETVLGLVKFRQQKVLEGRQVYSVIILARLVANGKINLFFNFNCNIVQLPSGRSTGCTFGAISQYICPLCVALITFQSSFGPPHMSRKCQVQQLGSFCLMWASPHRGYPKSKYSQKKVSFRQLFYSCFMFFQFISLIDVPGTYIIAYISSIIYYFKLYILLYICATLSQVALPRVRDSQPQLVLLACFLSDVI